MSKNKIVLIVIIIIFVTGLYILCENIIEKRDIATNVENINEDFEIVKTEDIKENTKENVDDKSKDSDTTTVKEKIQVYITGEVNNSGVFELDEGCRIVDAIDIAGGLTDKADISKINLAYLLADGMKITIPSTKILNEDLDFEYVVSGASDSKTDNKADTTNQSSSNEKKKSNIVNINTATQTELETLPGIGPSLALNIIDYRKENGKFSSINDIKNVTGIGDSKFDKIKELISV